MDPIKEAFSKIKEDISFLKNEILQLKLQTKDRQTSPAYNSSNIGQQTDIQTDIQADATHNHAVEPPYTTNSNISIRNRGVPTNTQSNTQTNQQTHIHSQITPNLDFRQANDILESLDSIKKEIRLKFKRLTPQEMFIFSTLYSLEEQNYPKITYRVLAEQIKLSESSIREYINKLINKGIPIDKTRQNNKTIILKISQDLKNIATLATIQNLRKL
jgi:biotin operon repressor